MTTVKSFNGKQFRLARKDTMTKRAAESYAKGIREGGLMYARVVPASNDPGYYEVYIRSRARDRK